MFDVRDRHVGNPGGNGQVDRGEFGRVPSRHRGGGCVDAGETRGQPVPDRQPSPTFGVGDNPRRRKDNGRSSVRTSGRCGGPGQRDAAFLAMADFLLAA
ncbi:MAG: hypothetical protein KDB39_06610, partial [Austwickia sp.]|nr:hypothetical protein [Austwickia sp.]